MLAKKDPSPRGKRRSLQSRQFSLPRNLPQKRLRRRHENPSRAERSHRPQRLRLKKCELLGRELLKDRMTSLFCNQPKRASRMSRALQRRIQLLLQLAGQ